MKNVIGLHCIMNYYYYPELYTSQKCRVTCQVISHVVQVTRLKVTSQVKL